MRVVVIGAGIVGASAARHLAEAGSDVHMVDTGGDGQATAAGAGIVFPYQLGDRPSGWEPLVAPALDHWAQVVDPFGAAAGVAAVGIVNVGPDGPDLRAVMTFLDALRERRGGVPLPDTEWLDTGVPARRFPPLRRDLAGIASPGVRRVDGRTLRDHLLALAEANGARRVTGAATLAAGADGVVVAVDGERLPADTVVAAAGAWSARLCEPVGLALPVVPVRGQVLHVDLPDGDTSGWPMIRAGERHYLLAFPGGRVVSGATHEPDAGFEHRATAGAVRHLLADALAVAPGLADATFAEVRVGFRPVSTDGLPVLGRVSRLPNLVVATGLGANGLTFGPSAGALAAELALGREPDVDLAAFRPDRTP
ncbi:MAG: FAD-binding oxidoreductase [Streptosporangiales bacterium]|nr:FAD-binding oxidoreductase [Streptosporangiales bacterium]MBO0889599.1 FAD-binding oxidoreductase [Acidothermales bacterium]